MNLADIKNTLAIEKIQLTKSLGQNFLHDKNQLGRIIGLAALDDRDQILEIGPGLGALTQLLLDGDHPVFAIEKDARLYRFLQRRFARHPHLTLIHADALDLLRRDRRDWSEWKLVSNLPYSCGSPILVELAESPHVPERLVVTVQTEVAERMAAKAGDDAYGVLSLLLQIRYLPGESFKIPGSCFFPAPDVESTCLALSRRPSPLLPAPSCAPFKKIVKRAFSERRKMMMKLLKADWPLERLQSAFESAGISPQARAETIALEQFVQLTTLLTQNSPNA